MPPKPTGHQVLGAALAFVVMAAAIGVGVMQLTTPNPAPADIPADQFSATRAMATVEAIAGNGIPHPGGSADNKRVREQLVAEIEEIGYEPILQSGDQTQQWFATGKKVPFDAPEFTSPFTTTSVTNILVRVPGTSDSSDAIIIDGHYDSVANGPGASDDGGAMAAFVETLRAMKASPPLEHDVIFLFSDAEESVLGGSVLFVTENEWAKDVKYVLNFEYRGTTGKSLFFEGSSVNQDLLNAYRESQSAPLASSLFYFAYQQLENSTDFSILDTLGAPGLAFAPIGNNVRYHTPSDNLENFSPGALQYTGDMLLGLIRSIADQPSLDSNPEQELVWFTVGPILVSYPVVVAYALLALALILLIIAIVVAARRDMISMSGIARGAVTAAGSAVLGILITQLLLGFVYLVRWDTRAFISLSGMFDTDPYRGQLYMVTFVFAVGTATVALLIRARKFHSVESLQLGALLVWAVLAILGTLAAPPAAYLVAIPLLLMSAAYLVRVLVSKTTVVTTVDLILSFVVVVFIFPVLALIYQGLNLSTGFLVSFFAALTICILLPVLDLIGQAFGQYFTLVLGATAAVLLAIGTATPLVGPNYQQPNSLVYAIDANNGTAQWFSDDSEPDEWTQNVLGANPASEPAPAELIMYYPVEAKRYETQTVLSNPARVTTQDSAPALKVQSDRTSGGQRVVEFDVRSTRDALNLWYTMTTDGEFKTLAINGKPVPAQPSDTWSVLGQGIPADGYTVEVGLAPGSSFDVLVTDQTNTFPDDPALGLPPRPDTTFSWWPRGKQADATLVTKNFDLS